MSIDHIFIIAADYEGAKRLNARLGLNLFGEPIAEEDENKDESSDSRAEEDSDAKQPELPTDFGSGNVQPSSSIMNERGKPLAGGES
jgi:hypothetical protein